MNLKKAAQKKLKKSGGFTLVEMLIVVAIIAILVVVTIPMVNSSLEEARKATDAANERAARAAAMVHYMSNPSTGTTVIYDYKSDGSVSTPGTADTRPTTDADKYKYGQSSTNKGGFVQVTITTATGQVTTKWVGAETGG